MRALKIALVTLCIWHFAGETADGQRVAVLTDAVRSQLAADWDTQRDNPYQVERAYCLRYGFTTFVDEQAYLVTSATPAKTYEAGPNNITYLCEPGPNVATLHVHTPASCDGDGKCVKEGIYARQCFPSDVDNRALVARREKFAMIQCDRSAVVFYWPDGIVPPARR